MNAIAPYLTFDVIDPGATAAGGGILPIVAGVAVAAIILLGVVMRGRK